MDTIKYAMYFQEFMLLLIGIVLIVRGIMAYKKEIKGGRNQSKLRISVTTAIMGVVLILILLEHSNVLYDPCKKSTTSYECLDLNLRLKIQENIAKQHRSEGK